MPDWVKHVLDDWLSAAGITSGKLFRRVNRAGRTWGKGMTERVVWHVVREFAAKAGIDKLAPHDLKAPYCKAHFFTAASQFRTTVKGEAVVCSTVMLTRKRWPFDATT